MNSQYIETELKKVLESAEYPKNMALASAWIIAHFKGINIKIFDVSNTSSLCDYNIVASSQNMTQSKAIVNEIQVQLKNLVDANINSLEGLQDGEWVLLDMMDCIVHIFQEQSREMYNLEALWEDAKVVEIPNEYYFGAGEEVKEGAQSSENYF